MLRLALLLARWHCLWSFAGCLERVEEEGGRCLGRRSASRGTVFGKEEDREEGRIQSGRAEVQVVRHNRCDSEGTLAEERIGSASCWTCFEVL